MPRALSYLTIKPTASCAFDCPYCASRQELLRHAGGRALRVDEWSRVFGQADALGVDYLDISGGEPAFYRGIEALIWEARRYGWFVSLNTSGYGLRPGQLERLEAAGLNQVILSVMSLDPDHETELRRKRGRPNSALESIRMISSSNLRLVIHFIVSSGNYTELPLVIDTAFQYQANSLSLVYPENDFSDHYLLLNEAQIAHLRSEILPEAKLRYARQSPFPAAGLATLERLYAAHGSGGDFANGIYWHSLAEVNEVCRKPDNFALIYPNGDVLPCNGIEYVHEPIAGNVQIQSLSEIWEGPVYRAFSQERLPFCGYCPIKRHSGIAIATQNNPPYAAPVVRHVPENHPALRPPVRLLSAGLAEKDFRSPL